MWVQKLEHLPSTDLFSILYEENIQQLKPIIPFNQIAANNNTDNTVKCHVCTSFTFLLPPQTLLEEIMFSPQFVWSRK